jgi:hypothetical protein
MHGVQPRSLTNRELVRHCANELELTTSQLPHEFQMELVRRLNLLIVNEEYRERGVPPYVPTSIAADPEAD